MGSTEWRKPTGKCKRMNIIIVGRKHGESRTYTLGASARTMMFGFLLVLPFAMGATGFWLAERLADEGILDPNAAKAWERDKRKRTVPDKKNATRNHATSPERFRVANL